MKKLLFINIFFFCFFLNAIESEDRSYLEANSRFQNGNYNLAYEKYKDYIVDYPNSRRILNVKYKKALCLYYTNKIDEAVSEFKLIEEKYRRSKYVMNVKFWLALCNYKLRNYNLTVEFLEHYLSESADLAYKIEALKFKSLALIKNNNLNKAKKAAYDLYKEDGNSFESTKILLYVLSKTNESSEVKYIFENKKNNTLINKEKNELLFYKAEAEFSLGNYELAEADYNELLSYNNMQLLPLIRLYLINKSKNNQIGKDAVVKKLEDISSDYDNHNLLQEFWLRIGIESFNDGNYKVAKNYFLKLKTDIMSSRLLELRALYLAAVYYEEGLASEAVRILKQENFEVYLEEKAFYLAENLNILKLDSELEKYYDDVLSLDLDSEIFNKAVIRKVYNSYFFNQKQLTLDLIESFILKVNSESFISSLLRLKARILFENKDYVKASIEYDRYFKYEKDDFKARLEKFKCLYFQKEWKTLLFETGNLLSSEKVLGNNIKAQVLYLNGLALISQKKYKEALGVFDKIKIKNLSNGNEVLIPYLHYYIGWSYYKISDYNNAVISFDNAARINFKLKYEALYFSAWCYYNMSEYEKTVEILNNFNKEEAGLDIVYRADFIRAKAHKELGEIQKAKNIFKSIFLSKNIMSESALFESAVLFVNESDLKKGISLFEKLLGEYPESPFGIEAAYRIAESYYLNQNYSKALQSFKNFRFLYPKSSYEDAALYWAALSALALKEPYKALLLFDLLIIDYTNSSFRYEAILKSAELLYEDSRYSEALDLYKLALSEYSNEINTKEVKVNSEKIKLIMSGKTSIEAELAITIGKENSKKTYLGRKAIVELSKIYIYRNDPRQKSFIKFLKEIIKEKKDSETNSLSLYLLGEYNIKKGDYDLAADYFIRSAFSDSSNKDFIAKSILRAAESAALAGNEKESLKMINTIFKNYPESVWSEKAEELKRVYK